MVNCLIGNNNKKKAIVKHVQCFNKFNLNETRHKQWNPIGKIYNFRDKRYGVLMLLY